MAQRFNSIHPLKPQIMSEIINYLCCQSHILSIYIIAVATIEDNEVRSENLWILTTLGAVTLSIVTGTLCHFFIVISTFAITQTTRLLS